MLSEIKILEENTLGRDFIVSDIHGCYHYLEKLLEKVDFDYKTDRLISVGDLCDRGPYSAKVLDYLREPWFFAVKGNHEDLYIQCVELGNCSTFMYNGGRWVNDQPDIVKELILDRFKELPLTIEFVNNNRKIGIIHAEFPINLVNNDWEELKETLEKQTFGDHLEQIMLWSRSRIGKSPEGLRKIDNVDYIFHGHTILEKITEHNNCIYIDTGSFVKENGYGITLVELTKSDFIYNKYGFEDWEKRKTRRKRKT